MKRIVRGVLGLFMAVGITATANAQNAGNCYFVTENQVECRVNDLDDVNNDGFLDEREWNRTGVFEREAEYEYEDGELEYEAEFDDDYEEMIEERQEAREEYYDELYDD